METHIFAVTLPITFRQTYHN